VQFTAIGSDRNPSLAPSTRLIGATENRRKATPTSPTTIDLERFPQPSTAMIFSIDRFKFSLREASPNIGSVDNLTPYPEHQIMKKQILAALFATTFAASGITFAADGFDRTGSHIAADGFDRTASAVAADGSERVGDKIAADGFDRTGSNVAEDGFDSTGSAVAEDGSERVGDKIAADGFDRTGSNVAEDGFDRTASNVA
jgi:hypothetical protein